MSRDGERAIELINELVTRVGNVVVLHRSKPVGPKPT